MVVFDHHGEPEFEQATSFIAADGSLVTNMLKLLLERGIQITPMQATAFALGIHEDTGSLTYASTTHRDIEALAACVRAGANQELLARYLRGPLQPDQRDLLRRLDAARTESEVAGLRLVTAAAEADGYVEDVSTLVTRIGDVADWDVLAPVGGDGGPRAGGRAKPDVLGGDRPRARADRGWGPRAGGLRDRARVPTPARC